MSAIPFCLVILQKSVLFSVDLVTQDFVEDYVFRASEQVLFHLGIGLFELSDQVLVSRRLELMPLPVAAARAFSSVNLQAHWRKRRPL